MSRLWRRSAYSLYWRPAGLNWCQSSGVLRPSTIARGEASGALVEALTALQPDVPVRQLLVSDSAVVYSVVDWPKGIAQRAELLRYAEATLLDSMGLRPGEYQLTMRTPRAGSSLFLCAWPSPERERLQAAFGGVKRAVPRVMPLFSTVFDAMVRQLPATGWLLVTEPHQVTLGGWANQSWATVQSLSAHPAEANTIIQRLRQLSRLHALPDDAPVFHFGSCNAAWSSAFAAVKLNLIDARSLCIGTLALEPCLEN